MEYIIIGLLVLIIILVTVSLFKNINERTEDDKKFVIKEAELIIADYLKETEPDNTSVKRKLRRLKCTSAILGLLLIVSIIF